MALLVLLLFFHLILDINSQYVPQPRLLVSPEVLTVSGSVYLHCDVPHSVKVSQCYFYPERDDTNIKLSPSCQLSVTGSELIRWTGRSSPGTLHIICYYTVDNSWNVSTPSPHSLPAPVTVLNEKPVLSVTHDDQVDEFSLVCETPESESVRADFSCNLYTGENPQPYRTQTSQKRQSGKLVCIFTAERNDLFRRLQSVKSDEVSCDYSLISDPTARSLMSDKYIIHFFPEPTQSSTTNRPTTAERVTRNHPHSSASAPTNSFSPPKMSFTTEEKTTTGYKLSTATLKSTTTEEKSIRALTKTTTTRTTTIITITTKKTKDKSPTGSVLVLMLSVTGVCVLLAVLMSVCLCRFIKKQEAARCKMDLPHDDQGAMMSIISENTFTTDAAVAYSVISSVPLPSLSLDTSGDKGSQQTGDDVYHMYCTIVDTQVNAKGTDAAYSLLQSTTL